MLRFLIAMLMVALVAACSPSERTYDFAILNGRVIDPETGLDAVMNVGISDGRIVEISEGSLQGRETIDASGLVVAPGFIDIHSHSPSILGAHFQVLDGVTTQLDLEAGAFPVAAYGYQFAEGAVLNFGSSTSHLAIRTKVIEGRDQPYLFDQDGPLVPGAAFVQTATADEIEAMRELLHEGIDTGGLGIGVLLDYMSVAVSGDELRMIFEVAAARNVPVFVHVRRGLPGDSAGLIEVIEHAEATGAALLVNHITHSAMQATGDWLQMIDAANARNANITTETLSYAAGGTSISAAVFSRDWQSIFGITYEDVQWTATGEWLTKETWGKYRSDNPAGMINHHYVKEDWMETALSWPRMMVSSDVTPALDRAIMANPNLAGTFTRLLGHYSRDRGVLDFSDAIARISLYPAQWLESTAPAFARKGRLQVGMDADIVIFDPATVQASATYGSPYVAPVGMNHVIVGGVPVVVMGEVIEDRYPGQRLLGEPEG